MSADLFFGTASWSEPSWVGPFYPEGTPPGEWLGHYATRFPAVEADTTYYAVPAPRLVRRWAEKTPDGFVLCAKFPKSIVHGGQGARPDPAVVLVPDRVAAETERFLGAMALLGKKCGPLVLQFPYFNRTAFRAPGPFRERLDRFLETLPRDFSYAVELRNHRWIDAPLLEILRRHRAALVLVELGYLPHPADIAARHDVVTSDFLYARLVGDRRAVDEKTKTFDRVVLDRGPSLDRWAGLLSELARRVAATFVFANNHYAGHGPATIRDLVRRLSGGERDQSPST